MVTTKITTVCLLSVVISGIASVLGTPVANYDAYLKEAAELRARGKLHPRASPTPGQPGSQPPTSSRQSLAFPSNLPYWACTESPSRDYVLTDNDLDHTVSGYTGMFCTYTSTVGTNAPTQLCSYNARTGEIVNNGLPGGCPALLASTPSTCYAVCSASNIPGWLSIEVDTAEDLVRCAINFPDQQTSVTCAYKASTGVFAYESDNQNVCAEVEASVSLGSCPVAAPRTPPIPIQ